jgi:hypothetical protein
MLQVLNRLRTRNHEDLVMGRKRFSSTALNGHSEQAAEGLLQEVVFDDSEQKELRKLWDVMCEEKVTLADATLALSSAQQAEDQAIVKAKQATSALQAKAIELAKLHGAPASGTSLAGTWELDPATMTLRHKH